MKRHLFAALALLAAAAPAAAQDCPDFAQLIREARNNADFEIRYRKYESAEVAACNDDLRQQAKVKKAELFKEMNRLRVEAVAAQQLADAQRAELLHAYNELQRKSDSLKLTDSLLLLERDRRQRNEEHLMRIELENLKKHDAEIAEKMALQGKLFRIEQRAQADSIAREKARTDSIAHVNDQAQQFAKRVAMEMLSRKIVPDFLDRVELEHIEFERQGAKEIPPIFFNQAKTLQIFGLQRNKIERIPPEIAQLQVLHALNLSHNRIKELPPELFELRAMEGANLSGNHIERLPPEVGGWHRMRFLNLSGNKLRELPDRLGDCAILEELHLADNRIEVLPETIGFLGNLRVLNLSRNKLKKLPECLFGMDRLDQLNLKGNKLPREEVERLRAALPRTEVVF